MRKIQKFESNLPNDQIFTSKANVLEFLQNRAKKSGINPLNPNQPFEKSFMTDLLQGLIKNGHKIKSVPVENGWLELDTIHDYEIYNQLYQENRLQDLNIVEK